MFNDDSSSNESVLLGRTFGEPAEKEETWIDVVGDIGKELAHQVPARVDANAYYNSASDCLRALIAIRTIGILHQRR